METSGAVLDRPCWLEREDSLLPIVVVTPVREVEDCHGLRSPALRVSDPRRMTEPMMPQLLTSGTEKHLQRKWMTCPPPASPAIVLALRDNSELFDGQL